MNPRLVGLPLLAYIFVRDDEKPGEEETSRRVAEIPEVLEVHHVAGEDCFLVKVRAADTDSLHRLLRERLGHIGSIKSTRTTIVLDTVRRPRAAPRGAGGCRSGAVRA